MSLDRPVTIGREAGSDVCLDDPRISRRHARVTPGTGAALVEDLGSSNGTFVNHNPVHGSAPLSPGDELLVGVTVFELRRQESVEKRPSAVHEVPAALAVPPPPPPAAAQPAAPVGTDVLDPFLDMATKQQARLAPLAVFGLVALVLLVYFGAR